MPQPKLPEIHNILIGMAYRYSKRCCNGGEIYISKTETIEIYNTYAVIKKGKSAVKKSFRELEAYIDAN